MLKDWNNVWCTNGTNSSLRFWSTTNNGDRSSLSSDIVG